MRIRVTAIVVAKHGGEWLDQTLAGLASQTRAPDRIVGVINGGRESVITQFGRLAPSSRIVATPGEVPFGAAVQQGVTMMPAFNASEGAGAGAAGAEAREQITDWFWLLTEDSAPEPAALEQVLATVSRAPSVAIAGPKLIDWDHPDRIIELGQSLTTRGTRWLLRRQERDQQQYDHLQDVLGVGPVGMLVRLDVWHQLEGFDPAYRVYDDGLDLSIRARLAGYRVVVSPTSRLRFARRGIAGPRIDRSRHVLRVAHREARTSGLHRFIAYTSGFAAFFTWLVLPLIGLGRMAWALLREQPGHVWGEFSAAMRVFFSPGSLRASRRRVKRANQVGWGAVTPLRVDRKTVRTARMIDREAILAAQGRLRDDLHFISTGGLAVLIIAALASIGLTWWAITQTSLAGGGLAPLSPIGELWANTRMVDGVPADPFTWVLAVLGTLTFFNPTQAVVLFVVAAVPLAALGGWLWAAQLTTRTPGRVLLGIAWAFSPVLLGSLAAGRLPTLVLAVVLPWLLLAASRVRDSWSWAGLTSLLAAVALASAPVLIPGAIVLLVVGLFTSHHGVGRVLSTVIAPLALFTPVLLSLFRGRSPIDVLLDPGIVVPFEPATPWQLMLGFAEGGLEGWSQLLAIVGLGGFSVVAVLGIMFAMIVLLAGVGLVTGRVTHTVMHAVLGAVGLLTAVLSANLQLVSAGSAAVTIWTGSGLTLYWISLLSLAVIGADGLRRAATPVVGVGLLLALIAVGPLAVQLATANTSIVAGSEQMPALVRAAGAQDPALRTLELTPEDDAGVRARVITGSGVVLDGVRTGNWSPEVTDTDQWVAELVAELSSSGSENELADNLLAHRISFVLLDTDTATGSRSTLQTTLEQHAVLEDAGQTSHGLLWRVAGSDVWEAGEVASDGNTAGVDAGAGASGASAGAVAGWFTTAGANLIWTLQIIVLIGMVLLALPTGAVVERPERRGKRAGAVAGGEAYGAAQVFDAPDEDGDGVGTAGAAGGSDGDLDGDEMVDSVFDPLPEDEGYDAALAAVPPVAAQPPVAPEQPVAPVQPPVVTEQPVAPVQPVATSPESAPKRAPWAAPSPQNPGHNPGHNPAERGDA